MADARVNILLALQAKAFGVAEASAKLEALDRNTRRVGDEWDQLAGKLARKFSLPDLAGDLLKGFGIGSAGAIVERGLDWLVEKHRAAVERIERDRDASLVRFRKSLEGLALISSKQKEYTLSLQSPDEQLRARRSDLASNLVEQERQQGRAGEAARALQTAKLYDTVDGADGLPEVLNSRKALDEYFERKSKEHAEAEEKRKNAALAELEIRKEIAALEKRSVDEAERKFNAEVDARLAAAKGGPDIAAQKEITSDQEAAAAAEGARFNAELATRADRLRDLINPSRQYAQQLDEIAELERMGRITSEEAAAARVRAAFINAGGFAPAIDASNEALRRFQTTLEAIDRNPFLTDTEKHAQRVAQLRQENDAIEAQIKLLQKFAADHPGVDPAQVRSQIRGLQDRSAKNAGEIGQTNLGAAGVQTNLLADVASELNRLKTPAQNVANTITSSIGGAFSSVSSEIRDCMFRTGDWNHLLGNVGLTIAEDLVGGLIEMGAKWIEQQILMAVFGKSLEAAGNAATLASQAVLASSISALMVGPATLTTIATAGEAAALAPAEMTAAMMATKPLALFDLGGYTGDISPSEVAGYVHGREFVFSAPAVAEIGRGNLEAMHDTALSGGTSSGRGSYAGAVGAPAPGRALTVVPLFADDRRAIEALRRDPLGEKWVVDVMKKNRRKFGGRL